MLNLKQAEYEETGKLITEIKSRGKARIRTKAITIKWRGAR